jgi:photosystem II stability/assembly factor-like uncharacterized protein
MSFQSRSRLWLLLLLATISCRDSTEPTPPLPPGAPVVRIDNVVRGVTDASLLTAFTASDGTVWTGGNVGAVFRRKGNLPWQWEEMSLDGIITGIWQASDGTMLLVAGRQLRARDTDSPTWSVVPLNNNSVLLDLWGLDGERMFIGGTGGTILRHEDGEWIRAETPVATEVWGIAGSSEEDLVAVGQNGTILESDDGGRTWHQVPSPTSVTLFAVATDGAGRFVAVGGQGKILLRDGDSWELTSSPTTQNLFDVKSNGPGQFVVVGDGGVIFEGNGLVWQQPIVAALHENFRAVTGTNGKRTVVGWWGAIVEEDRNWSASHSGSRLYAAHVPPGGGNAMVVGQGGAAFERRNGEWQSITIPTPASLLAMAGPTGNNRIAVGDSGTVLRYDGLEWRQEDVPYLGVLRSIWYDGNRALAVGEGGIVLARENGSWRQVASPTLQFLRHVGGRSWDNLIIVGDSGILMRWNGQRVDRLPVQTQRNLRASLMRAHGDGYVIGDDGILLYFNGVSWSVRLGPTLNSMRSIHEVDGVVYIAGELGQIWRLEQGNDWTPLPTDQIGFWLDLAGEDELIAVGEFGTIARGVR